MTAKRPSDNHFSTWLAEYEAGLSDEERARLDAWRAHFRQEDKMDWPTVASDEDVTTGYMEATAAVPAHPDLRLGLFVVLARREWDRVYDPAKLSISAYPRGFKWVGDEPEGDSDEAYSAPV